MNTRTNLHWKGDRIVGFVTLMLMPAMPLVMSIVFLFQGGGSPPAALFMLAFGSVLSLIVFAFLRWTWDMEDDQARWLLAYPARWLVHWQYDQATWQKYARSEREHKLFEAIASAAVMSVIGLLILLMSWHIALADLIIVSGLVVLWPLGYLLSCAILTYYRILNTVPEAYITRSELYIGGRLYDWRNNNVQILNLQLIHSQCSTLEFTLRIGSSRYQRTDTVRIPVPSGQEERAEEVVHELASREEQQSSF